MIPFLGAHGRAWTEPDAQENRQVPNHVQAMEIVRLKDRLAEAEEGRRETHTKLAAARSEVHQLEDRVMALEQDLDQSHTCAASLALQNAKNLAVLIFH